MKIQYKVDRDRRDFAALVYGVSDVDNAFLAAMSEVMVAALDAAGEAKNNEDEYQYPFVVSWRAAKSAASVVAMLLDGDVEKMVAMSLLLGVEIGTRMRELGVDFDAHEG